MAELIAEDLLLLLCDDESGKTVITSGEVDLALAGAVVCELALAECVRVTGDGEQVREGRLVVAGDDASTGDDVLDGALQQLRERKRPGTPQDVVSDVAKGLQQKLLDRLIASGDLREERGKILGLFPTVRWPAGDGEREARVRESLRTAIAGSSPAEPRTLALVSLLQATGALAKVVAPQTVGLDKRGLAARGKQLADGDWAAGAVKKAINQVNAGVAAATVAVAAATVTTTT